MTPIRLICQSVFVACSAAAFLTWPATSLRADSAASLIQAECNALGVSQYEIAFVTGDGTTATDSTIGDYNTFVTTEAGLAYSSGTLSSIAPLGASWAAIVSTDYQNAAANAPDPNGIPVFDTQGNLITSGTSSLYAGLALTSKLQFTQSGTLATPEVWTGSTVSGAGRVNFTAGNDVTNKVTIGYDDRTDTTWIAAVTGEGGGYYFPSTDTLPVYALSSEISVSYLPSFAIPEPAVTTSLLGMALLGMGGFFLRPRH
jgi:hypothetical protein